MRDREKKEGEFPPLHFLNFESWQIFFARLFPNDPHTSLSPELTSYRTHFLKSVGLDYYYSFPNFHNKVELDCSILLGCQ